MVKLKRMVISALCVILLLSTVGCQWGKPQNNGGGVDMNDLKVNTNQIPSALLLFDIS